MRAVILAAAVLLTVQPHATAADPKPEAEAYYNRGLDWLEIEDYDKAIADLNEAIRLDRAYALAYTGRGDAWAAKKDYGKAVADYNEAIRLDPNGAEGYEAYWGATWLMATCTDGRYRNGKKAVELATKFHELVRGKAGKDAKCASTWVLAAAYAEAGDFDSAVKYQTEAIELNRNDLEYVDFANEVLRSYKDHTPWRQ